MTQHSTQTIYADIEVTYTSMSLLPSIEEALHRFSEKTVF